MQALSTRLRTRTPRTDANNAMADFRSDVDRASEHFLNYMTSCALGETSVESESGAWSGGCESAAVHHSLASLDLDGGGDDGERCVWLGPGPLTNHPARPKAEARRGAHWEVLGGGGGVESGPRAPGG